MIMECCQEKHKATPRSEEEIKDIRTRLNRVNGQINGIQKMIEENRYCGDVLIQLSASIQALKQVAYLILENHMKTCIASDPKEDKFESIDEMIGLIEKLR